MPTANDPLGFPILLIGPLRTMPPETCAKLLGRVVPRFSKVATIAVMSLILTGLVATLLHIPSLSALQSTSYGRALSVKLWLLVFLLALGAWNLRLRGREPFGSLVRVELALAIGIFAATGFLTSLPPADATPPVAPNPTESLRQPPTPPVQGATNTNTPSAEKAANDVVRVSGTPGTSYSGTYGTGEKPETANNTLGTGFTDYEVEVGDGGVSAAFKKTQTGEGILKLEILAGGEVVAERETSEESGTVAVSWSPGVGSRK